MFKPIFVLVCLAVGAYSEPSSLREAYAEPCAMDDDQCLQQQFNNAVDYVVRNGAPECGVQFDLNPYDMVNEQQGLSFEVAQHSIVFEKGQIYGLTDLEHTNLEVNWEKNEVEVTLTLDSVHVEGEYSLEGRCNGDGYAEVDLKNIEINGVLYVEVVPSDGENYLQLNSVKVNDFSIGDLKLNASSVQCGKNNRESTESFNNMINNNWMMLDLSTVVEAISDIYADKVSKIFDCIPVSEFVNYTD